MANGLSQVGSLIEAEIEKRIQQRIGSFEEKMRAAESKVVENTNKMTQATNTFEQQGRQKLQDLDKTYLQKFQALEQRLQHEEQARKAAEQRLAKAEEKLKGIGKILS